MLSYPLGGKIDPPAIPALFDLFLNHLFVVDFKLCFFGERRFFHSEGDVRTALFSFVSYNLGGKVMMNDRQTFFPLRGALSCYIEKRSEHMSKLRSGRPWLRREAKK